jgi:hypothetical protein
MTVDSMLKCLPSFGYFPVLEFHGSPPLLHIFKFFCILFICLLVLLFFFLHVVFLACNSSLKLKNLRTIATIVAMILTKMET